MEKPKEWYVFDPTDFEGIMVDATKWEDDLYTVAFNFFCTRENEEEPNVGFTLCTTVHGSNLQECHERVMEILNSGIFDDIEVSSQGTLYDKDGNELEEIMWNEFTEESEDDSSPEPPPTLH